MNDPSISRPVDESAAAFRDVLVLCATHRDRREFARIAARNAVRSQMAADYLATTGLILSPARAGELFAKHEEVTDKALWERYYRLLFKWPEYVDSLASTVAYVRMLLHNVGVGGIVNKIRSDADPSALAEPVSTKSTVAVPVRVSCAPVNVAVWPTPLVAVMRE